ncbi:MAG: energy transducer TonB [Bacteroidia bacterium]|nr:energy transducer TonB [Bacteroidia bacterium]
MRNITLIFLLMSSLASFGQLKAYSDTCYIGLTRTKETFTIPEVQAEYIGGFKKMFDYINQNVTYKVVLTQSEFDIFKTPVAQWTIDETGTVIDVKIIKSSNISKIDNLYLAAIENMPKWKPAEKFDKTKTRQEFRFPLKICFK